MTAQHTAQGLASLGRRGDSMLVHMQPQEVADLQSIAMAHGGSLTINPATGLPEANFLGSVFRAIAPLALGAALGPAGLGLSALQAGLAVGVGAYALTGDPMAGLSAGLGSFGGAGLGSNLAGFGATPKTVLSPSVANVADVAKSAIPTPGLDAAMGAGISKAGANAIATPGLDSAIGSTIATKTPAITGPGVNLGSTIGSGTQLGVGKLDLIPSATPNLESAATGIKKLFEPGGFKSYADYVTSIGGSPTMDALTAASPYLTSALEQPAPPIMPVEPEYDYDGPYTTQNRAPRMPTPEEQRQLMIAGSPEFNYFGVSNPVPGYKPFAQGGSIQSGGIRDLYGTSDNQLNSPPLSRNGYGLGRLDSMYGMSDAPPAPLSVMASGGPVSFEAGGQIPSVPALDGATQGMVAGIPQVMSGGAGGSDMGGILNNIGRQNQTQMVGPLAGMNPASIAYKMQLQNMQQAQQAQSDTAGLNSELNQAIRDPMGRVGTAPVSTAPALPQLSLEAPVQAAQGGIMSLARGGKPSSGGYLDGPGDGMSDDIPATIAGKQPARLADGEFVIPADVVSHLGNGSTKAGAKHLYKMMDRVRQARTGTKKQGRQINPSKYLKA